MNAIQAMVNQMNADMCKKRAETQMTLGKLIARLKELPAECLVDGFSKPHSYRGYYSDLAFEPSARSIRASEALEICQGAMGQAFEGYKGGDYTMGRDTPVWIARCGDCGKRIMAILDGGALELADDDG